MSEKFRVYIGLSEHVTAIRYPASGSTFRCVSFSRTARAPIS